MKPTFCWSSDNMNAQDSHGTWGFAKKVAWHSLTGIIKENHSFWKKSLSPNTQKDEIRTHWKDEKHFFKEKVLSSLLGKRHILFELGNIIDVSNTISLEIFWMNNKTITLIIISLPSIANMSMTNNKRNSISKMGGSESRICRRDLWGTEKIIIFRQPLKTKDKKPSRE